MVFLASKAGEIHRIAVGPRVYLMRGPSQEGKIRYRRDMAAGNIVFHRTADLCDTLDAAIAGRGDAAAMAAARGCIEEYLAANDGYAKLVIEADEADLKSEAMESARLALASAAKALDPYARVARAASAEYAAMVADNAVYWDRAGLLAAQSFMSGWEGIEEEFPGDPAVAAERIPPQDLAAIGLAFDGLMRISPAQRKNSVTA